MKLTESQLETLIELSAVEIESLRKALTAMTNDRNTYKDLYYYKEERYKLLEKKFNELAEKDLLNRDEENKWQN